MLLIQFLDKFLCVSLLFKNVPSQNPMFYTRVQIAYNNVYREFENADDPKKLDPVIAAFEK